MAEVVTCQVPFSCGHICGRLHFGRCSPCQHPVKAIIRKCGHVRIVPCPLKSYAEGGGGEKCMEKCGRVLSCGHVCKNKCSDVCGPCKGTGLCHLTLPCGHLCMNKCGEPCGPCQDPVVCNRTLQCGHLCKNKCGEPCGPCQEYVDAVGELLGCGHKKKVRCSTPAGAVQEWKRQPKCMEKCKRDAFPCNHPCVKLCYENCECAVLNNITQPKCGHIGKAPCRYDSTNNPYAHVPPKCKLLMPGYSPCGHRVRVPCMNGQRDPPEKLLEKCVRNCGEELSCGHVCRGKCKRCKNKRFHVRCSEMCGRPLICGHFCLTGCPKFCPPCGSACNNWCEHGDCKEVCGAPCSPCQKPCKYSCPHYSCTKKCGELCDRPPCFQNCTEKLKCGHDCIGYCGEPCPSLCLICNKTEIESKWIIGTVDLETTENPRFIVIKECGHIVESSEMTQWMEQVADDGQIVAKKCPFCDATIWNLRRFGSALQTVKEQVMEVKRHGYGDTDENNERNRQLYQKIAEGEKDAVFQEFKKYIDSFLVENDEEGKVTFKTNHKLTLNSIEVLVDVYMKAKEFFAKFAALIGWVETIRRYVYRLLAMFDWLIERIMENVLILPMTQQQTEDANFELQKIMDYIALLDLKVGEKCQDQPGPLVYTEYNDAFWKAVEFIFGVHWRYVDDTRGYFMAMLQKISLYFNTSLALSKLERLEIVRAFGERNGRWFKCPNGHIYVITECGGPTERTTCPQCGAPIGGLHHQLEQGNELAREMDGAVVPLYPVFRNNNAHFNNFLPQDLFVIPGRDDPLDPEEELIFLQNVNFILDDDLFGGHPHPFDDEDLIW